MGEDWQTEEWEEPAVIDNGAGVGQEGVLSNSLSLQHAMSQLSTGISSVSAPLPEQMSSDVSGCAPSSPHVSTPGISPILGVKTKGIHSPLDTSSVKKETQQPLDAASIATDWDTTPTADAPSPRLQRICPICFPPTRPIPYTM